MRVIKTLILRLYTGGELGEKICGDLRVLPGRKTNPFKNKSQLLGLVEQVVREVAKNSPLNESNKEDEANPPGCS